MPKIITIDGPAGSGKSTIAREVAKRLGFTYLDTGAMYRALTLKAIRANANLEGSESLIDLIKKTKIDIIAQKDGSLKVFLDKEDVTVEIRKSLVTQKVSFIAKIPGIRTEMVKLQRQFGKTNDIVVEGRDIGTVVFPNADRKFYLDADFNVRVNRRMGDFQTLGQNISLKEVEDDLKKRDNADMTRSVGPLKQAKDAILLDTTNLSIEEVIEKVLSYIK
ncbi:MAG: (d)CMP kinase [Candidatus Omnitrophica bacterium]|nr:(d)CMP kinase [Candidatus Omnitrophota bacterium]HOX54970.1 (d)CMP kinase [Candidatus Omnitrophota bacterium]